MSKNIKIFVLVSLVSIFSWWGVNLLQQDLEEFFYWYTFEQESEMFLAQVNMRPLLEKSLIKPKIEAESGMAIHISSGGKHRVLFRKETSIQRPIASLTKLMTALVAQELYNPDQIFIISKEAVDQEGERGELKEGEEIYLNELLHMVLIESSNDAAWALAEGESSGVEKFVELMNFKSKKLKLKDTHFVNPTGLDRLGNYSTSEDLVNLAIYIINNHPQIFEISKKQSYEVPNPDSTLHHFIPENTNKLLLEIPEIAGGKTGYTEEAGGCILLVLEDGKGGHFINVVLGTATTESRFEEMRKLVDFVMK